jgi:hypothetical protein
MPSSQQGRQADCIRRHIFPCHPRLSRNHRCAGLITSSPGLEQPDGAEAVALAREANEQLADAVRNHPARFAGLTSLPTAAPDAAVAELERMVRDYGFKVAVINGHIQGQYRGDILLANPG